MYHHTNIQFSLHYKEIFRKMFFSIFCHYNNLLQRTILKCTQHVIYIDDFTIITLCPNTLYEHYIYTLYYQNILLDINYKLYNYCFEHFLLICRQHLKLISLPKIFYRWNRNSYILVVIFSILLRLLMKWYELLIDSNVWIIIIFSQINYLCNSEQLR